MPSCGLSSSANVLGLALHQWSYKYVGNIARFAHTMKENIKTLQWARSLEEMEVRVEAAWMTGAKLKNKAHLQALLLRIFPAEDTSNFAN